MTSSELIEENDSECLREMMEELKQRHVWQPGIMQF